MPAKSKQQQKFMGLVHAYKKGEVPASKVSKAVKDAAKSMSKKSVRKYAKTKHDELPKKVTEDAGKDFPWANEKELKLISKFIFLSPQGIDGVIKMMKKDPSGFKKMIKKGAKAGLHEKRDYKAEYKKFQSSTKAKKYRAELNKYNRQKGTYGNGDGKDASHKGGKIVGFEAQSKNRGRREKSRLKKESAFSVKIDTFQNAMKSLDKLSDILKKGGEKKKSMMVSKLVKQLQQAFFRKEIVENITEDITKLEKLAMNLLRNINKNAGVQNYDHKKTADFNKVVKFLKGKMPKVPNLRIGQIAMSYDKYRQKQPKIRIPDIDSVKDMEKTLKKLGMKEGVNERKVKMTKHGTIHVSEVPSYQKDHYPTQKHWDYYQSLPKGKKHLYYKKYPEILAKASKQTDDFIAQQKKELGLESVNETVYHFKGFTNKQMDELDAMLYRAGVRGTPDFNKRTYTVDKEIPKLDKIMKMKGGKKIKEGTCGYGLDGNLGEEPAGPHLMKKIKKITKDKEKKLKENKQEKLQIAKTILSQLGGNRFVAMTGAKSFGYDSKGSVVSLQFRIGRNAKQVNIVRINYIKGKDLYEMNFYKGTKLLKKVSNVYADQLRKIFTKHTGMYTSL